MTTVAKKNESLLHLYLLLAVAVTVLIAAFVVACIFPLLFVFLLVLIVPISAYLFLRAKVLATLTPLLYLLVLAVNYNVVLVLCLPLLMLGFVACLSAAKGARLYLGMAILITAVLCSIALPIWLGTLVSDKNAGDTVGSFIQQSEDDHEILSRAKNFVYESEVADALVYTPTSDIEEIRRNAAVGVGRMTDGEVLAIYAAHVSDTVNAELMHFVFSTGILMAMSMFLILTLLLNSFQTSIKKAKLPAILSSNIFYMPPAREMTMPRRYALSVLLPFVLLFLLRNIEPLLVTIFDATYFGIILVPFAFSGFGVFYFGAARFKINPLLVSAVVFTSLLLVFLGIKFLFLVFSCVGIVDYFLNMRFLLEFYNKLKKEKKLNESNTDK